MENKLTAKQEKLCIEYLKCHNKAEAYRRAYDTENMNKDTIRRKAVHEFEKGNIRATIQSLGATAGLRNDITRDRILQEYRKIAFTVLPGIVNFKGGCMSIEDFDNLNEDQRGCIKSFKIKKSYQMGGDGSPEPVENVEVTLHDKNHALDMLAKYEGMMVDRKEITGANGTPLNPPTITVVPPTLDD